MKVLIISNNDEIIYWFRRELLSAIAKRHDIVIASPSGKYQLYFETAILIFQNFYPNHRLRIKFPECFLKPV